MIAASPSPPSTRSWRSSAARPRWSRKSASCRASVARTCRAPTSYTGSPEMSVRVERVAAEVRGVLGEVLSRDEIKDPRVRGAGLITVTHVRISGDLQHASALFTVHGLDAAALEKVRQGLNH